MTAITDFFKANPMLWEILKLVLSAVGAFIAVTMVLKVETKAMKRLREKRSNINFRFVENVFRFALILLAFQWVVMSSSLTSSFGKVLFQGTTVLAAIAGFAAQPVIADLICGLIISSTKPFDIGDRVELEDGTAGIVKDITLRHVVIQTIDTVRVIIPNSKLNAMKVQNMSFHTTVRSIHFRFNVGYGTDTDRAVEIIGRAVEESPLTIPGKPGENGGEYGPVYFIQFADSSLVMAVTVYFEPTHPSEVVKSDINSRVKKALEENGIEIPYNYVSVVMEEKEK